MLSSGYREICIREIFEIIIRRSKIQIAGDPVAGFSVPFLWEIEGESIRTILIDLF